MMMFLAIVSLVRMLLVVHDVKRNPDPTYTYMMSLPEEKEASSVKMTSIPLTIICSDGHLLQHDQGHYLCTA